MRLTDCVYGFVDNVLVMLCEYLRSVPVLNGLSEVFKSLVGQIAVGEPKEYSFRLIGRFDGLQFHSADKVLLDAEESSIPITLELKGEDYVEKKWVDNV